MRAQPQVSLSRFAAGIPFVCRCLCLALCTLYLLSLVGLCPALDNSLPQTYPQLQLWRLLTSSLYCPSLFTLMLLCLNLYTFLPKLQKLASSAWVLCGWLCWGTCIQVLYVCVLGLAPSWWGIVAPGDVHGVWLYYVTRYCYGNRGAKIKLMCLPVHIDKLAYPPIMALLLMLVAWQIKLDAVIGIVVAVLQAVSVPQRVVPMNWGQLRCMQGVESWVSGGEARGNPYAGLEGEGKWSSVASTGSGERVSYFSDKKGVRISDG